MYVLYIYMYALLTGKSIPKEVSVTLVNKI